MCLSKFGNHQRCLCEQSSPRYAKNDFDCGIPFVLSNCLCLFFVGGGRSYGHHVWYLLILSATVAQMLYTKFDYFVHQNGSLRFVWKLSFKIIVVAIFGSLQTRLSYLGSISFLPKKTNLFLKLSLTCFVQVCAPQSVPNDMTVTNSLNISCFLIHSLW